jgi:DNA repair exonuclease SbcCD ATPase subunit
MSGENETALTGAVEQVAPAENTEQVTQPAEAQTTTPAETVEQAAERVRDEKGRFQSRINEITARAGRAERALAEREARLAQLEAQLQQRTPVTTDKPPAFEDFQDLNQWAAATAEFAAAQAEKRAEQKFRERAQQSSQEQVFEQYAERERAYAAADPGYQDAYNALASSVRLQPTTLEVIAASDHGPAVIKHLGTHLDVADRISRLPPHMAAAEIARIEAQVKAPKAKPVSNAPPPAPVVGGASTVKKDPDAMPIEEWVRWRRDQLKAK